ncbi:lipopolysaccharide kinase InaA family protein [uncultured Desulfuromonas sp.]|uniref:lipopolysaccharide kinase InaA family protein n=1 Tax=uncultured Desulfuromonas sp. TaxID=181013 RepID=UPI002AABF69B|nr:lipopolysaccharide kinase InaA family protein [uncultured Desulfuromonas sp.]
MFQKSHTHWIFWGQENEKHTFSTLESSLGTKGAMLSKGPISYVHRVDQQNATYYVKIYSRNGKGLRHYFGRGRLQGEWENLLYFSKLGIPTPRIVAYGHSRRNGLFRIGALITAEVPDSADLLTLARSHPEMFLKRSWLKSILRQTAEYTSRLHRHGFIHWDLKWRNILVSQKNSDHPEIYFFDCPLGKTRRGWLRKRGVIKDLACLDKVGKKVLSRSQRLSFFKYYAGIDKVTTEHKKQILQIVNFFTEE